MIYAGIGWKRGLAAAQKWPMKRALCLVLDSVGSDHASDAAAYGDNGANTLGHLFERISGFSLLNLEKLGLFSRARESPTLIPRRSLPHRHRPHAGTGARDGLG
jgi:phosphopentomutase